MSILAAIVADLPALQIIQELRQAEVLFRPVRLQLLSLLREPSSAAALAPKLGIPRQLVNYHMRELERVGLAVKVSEHKRGNCVERVMRASAGSYVISPKTLGNLTIEPEDFEERFSLEYLVSLGQRMVAELTAQLGRSKVEGEQVPSLSIETNVQCRSAEERAEFARELARSIAQVVSKFQVGGGDDSGQHRLLLVMYPSLSEGPP